MSGGGYTPTRTSKCVSRGPRTLRAKSWTPPARSSAESASDFAARATRSFGSWRRSSRICRSGSGSRTDQSAFATGVMSCRYAAREGGTWAESFTMNPIRARHSLSSRPWPSNLRMNCGDSSGKKRGRSIRSSPRSHRPCGLCTRHWSPAGKRLSSSIPSVLGLESRAAGVQLAASARAERRGGEAVGGVGARREAAAGEGRGPAGGARVHAARALDAVGCVPRGGA